MCPLCIATSTVLLTGAGSAGGMTALVAKVLHIRRRSAQRAQTDGPLSQAVPGASSEMPRGRPRIAR